MTNDWPYDRIDNHVEIAGNRYTSQYDDMSALKSVAEVYAERLQAIEDSGYQLLTERWLDDAIGQQLDELGAVVGEERLGREDDPYRQAIKARIIANNGSGDAPTLLKYLSNATGITLSQEFRSTSVLGLSSGATLGLSSGAELEMTKFLGAFNDIRLTESMPATWVIYVGTEIRQPFASQMEPLVAAGVGAYLTSTDGKLPFGTKEEGEADPDNVGGLSEYAIDISGVLELSSGALLGLSSGSVLALNRTAEPPEAPIDGPRLAENYRVSI